MPRYFTSTADMTKHVFKIQDDVMEALDFLQSQLPGNKIVEITQKVWIFAVV